ncbi:four helix bundle protein [Candidatus Uhrbacteria bacterium]|nr:four helix bundle protein [Candidatus Uhrbacteria bacterium]
MALSSFEELIVWQKSMDLVVTIYKLTESFPRAELFGLTSQMRRSAVSIPSNIAEGSKRGTRKDFRSFLLNAYGSSAELTTQIKIAKRIHLASDANFTEAEGLLDEIMGMLNKMSTSLQTTNYKL